ncbi:MAG: hypothetical protein M0Z55_03115 [Peptococcaceae bacterium]|nr:hypothetical protein [Peptococcaceae bacterium]
MAEQPGKESHGVEAALEAMSKEELAQALTEAMQRAQEITSSTQLLVTHLKVLCYKNGGTLSYTIDEFKAASKQDYAFHVAYETENEKEVCFLRLLPREQTTNSAK